MNSRFRFTYEKDWRHAPLAYWVHVPNPDDPKLFEPPAPLPVPHHGFVLLRIEYGPHELVFSSPEQLAHFIEVMAKKPLPTSRALSAARGTGAGPNGHWLSRLPAALKPPAARLQLVRHLKAVYAMAVTGTKGRRGNPSTPPLWPGLGARASGAA
jgi:hypothetical protein